jgi:hypothetical protein
VVGLLFYSSKFPGSTCGNLRYVSFCLSSSTLLGGRSSCLFVVGQKRSVKSEHQPKLGIGGKSETGSQIYTVQQQRFRN